MSGRKSVRPSRLLRSRKKPLTYHFFRCEQFQYLFNAVCFASLVSSDQPPSRCCYAIPVEHGLPVCSTCARYYQLLHIAVWRYPIKLSGRATCKGSNPTIIANTAASPNDRWPTPASAHSTGGCQPKKGFPNAQIARCRKSAVRYGSTPN
jgi:hypothetical protein